MPTLFSRPYKHESSPKSQVRMALLFGLFVFAFLALFQPFELNTYQGNIWLFTLGYGAVTTVVMLVLNVFAQKLPTPYFNEAGWTVGREIFWTILNLLAIAITNTIYTSWAGSMSVNGYSFLSIAAYTLAVGFFPVAGAILWNESRLRHQYEVGSQKLNEALEVAHHQPKKAKVDAEMVVIPSENAGESFAVATKSLLFMKAAENYTEVYWNNFGTTKRAIVRANLKQLEDALLNHPQFCRCHKSYIVNLALVQHISGNAQGYKLHIKGAAEVLPISRRLNNNIKLLLETYA